MRIAKFEQQAEGGDAEVGAGGVKSAGGVKNVVLVADHEISDQIAHQMRERFGSELTLALIAPAVTRSRLDHLAGNADEGRAEAEVRLEESLPALEREGIRPEPTAVGDQDPVIAVEDALREFADVAEVVLVINAGNAQRWAEHDAFDRVRRRVGVPLTVLEVDEDGSLVDSEHSDPGTDPVPESEVGAESDNLPPFSLQDALAVIVAIIGTIVLVVLAAEKISDADSATASALGFGGVVTGLLALAFLVINFVHVLALTLFESAGYRGVMTNFFARMSLYGTPAAVVIALILR